MVDDFEIDNELLDGPDYVDYEWWDETSQFDPHPTRRWAGLEYCERRYRCRVPKDIYDQGEEAADQWVYDNLGRIKYLD